MLKAISLFFQLKKSILRTHFKRIRIPAGFYFTVLQDEHISIRSIQKETNGDHNNKVYDQ